jgi:fatty-acyl-CoA synthase
VDISEWIAHWGNVTPHKAALRFEGSSISYAELETHVAGVAAWLTSHRVSAGDRVAYLGPNCPELLEVLLACARLRAVFVPFNARMPAAELRIFVELTRPRLILADDALGRVARDCLAERVPDDVITFRAGYGLGGAAACPGPAMPAASVEPAGGVGVPVLVAFTSGTTGRPKGATFTNENLVFNALNAITAFGLSAADEILTAVPMFHSGGLFIHTTPALCAGATLTIHREFGPARLLEDVARYRVSLLACPPAITYALTADPAWELADLSSLRWVVTGSTTVPARAIEPWQRKGVRVTQGYGSTETSPIITTRPSSSPDAAAATAGKPGLHHQVRVVDRNGTDLPAGEPGEVWICGPAVMQGYWGNPQATREAFCDGWFRTGDLGRFDETGYLHIVDRIKDIIIVGSSNVYPADLEAVLADCADIREAAVIAQPDEVLGEVPIACVVAAPDASLTPQRVLALFANRLASYKHPRKVIFLDALPRTATAKVDKAALRTLVACSTQPHESLASDPAPALDLARAMP